MAHFKLKMAYPKIHCITFLQDVSACAFFIMHNVDVVEIITFHMSHFHMMYITHMGSCDVLKIRACVMSD